MKFVYYSSVLNHHQRCLCDAFFALLGEDFRFVQTMPMERQRIELGYQQEDAPYVIKTYESEENRIKAEKLAVEADVMLASVFPVELLYERMRQNKLTFRHIETYFKSGKYRLLSPNAMRIVWMEHTRYRRKPLYLLCASAHTAKDVNLFGAYPCKKFKWGYFPPLEMLGDIHTERGGNEKTEFLWCGRMLEWKKPMYAIRTVQKLHKKGYSVHLNMVGTGPELERLKACVERENMTELVTFCGPVPPARVRMYMRRADVFFFTSTRQEGWGAVLNEAMNSGCTVLASEEAGATGYLVKHGKNGLVYKHNNLDQLAKLAEKLCNNKDQMRYLGTNAAATITELWNYRVAAERLVKTAQALLEEQNGVRYEDGPMSIG